jgi:ribosomal protein L7Ae-like RNA K-turn-binding protein
LLRFVVAGDPPQLVPDVPRRASGRGVSVHPRRRCLDAAVKNGGLRRALKCDASVAVNADDLARWASGQYSRKLDGLLGAAQRSGHAAVGTERARDAIAARRAALIVVASDASEQRQQLMASAERLGQSCLLYGDKASLGRLFGRETVAVVAVTDPNIAEEVQRAARCAALLGEAS